MFQVFFSRLKMLVINKWICDIVAIIILWSNKWVKQIQNQRFIVLFHNHLFVSVTLTACAQANHDCQNEIMMIKNVKVHVGINSLASIQSSGIFTCENPGLYLVDASIVNKAGGSTFSIRKNRSVVIQSYGSLHDQTYESASLVAAVELNIGDTIDIHADNSVYLRSLGSCVTIVKIR